MVVYRKATSADTDAICGLWSAAGVGAGHGVDSAEIAERLKNDDGFFVVEEVERRFLDAGVTQLRLAVWDENGAALSFWRELAYVELPEIRYFSKEL